MTFIRTGQIAAVSLILLAASTAQAALNATRCASIRSPGLELFIVQDSYVQYEMELDVVASGIMSQYGGADENRFGGDNFGQRDFDFQNDLYIPSGDSDDGFADPLEDALYDFYDFEETNKTRLMIFLLGDEEVDYVESYYMQILKGRGVQIIVATYNAVPTAFQASLASPGERFMLSLAKYTNQKQIADSLLARVYNLNGTACALLGTGNLFSFDGLQSQITATGVFWLLDAPRYSARVQGLFLPCYDESAVSCLKAISFETQDEDVQVIVYHRAGSENNIEIRYYDDDEEDFVTYVPGLSYNYGNPGYFLSIVVNTDGSKTYTIDNKDESSTPLLEVTANQLGFSLLINGATGQYNQTTGLCGLYNGCPDDDMGMFPDDQSSFVESNRVAPASVRFEQEAITLPTRNIPASNSNKNSVYGTQSQSCGGLPSGFERACNNDVSSTGAIGIASGYSVMADKECEFFCVSGRFRLQAFNGLDCSGVCRKENVLSNLNLTAVASENLTINSPPYSVDIQYPQGNETKITIVEPVAGTYCLNSTIYDTFGRQYETTQYVSIACEGSAFGDMKLNYENISVPLNLHKDFTTTTVKLKSSVDQPNRVKKISWAVVSKPEMAFSPTIIGNNSYTPSFNVSVHGEYVLNWVVYDGCRIFQQNVSVTATCPGTSEQFGPLAFMQTSSMVTKQGYSSDYDMIVAYLNEFGLYNQFYNISWDFSQLDPELVVDQTTDSYYIHIGYPERNILINETLTIEDPYPNGYSEDDAPAITPIYNQLTNAKVYGFQNYQSEIYNYTFGQAQYVQYSLTTPYREVCSIYLPFGVQNMNPTLRYSLFMFTDIVPGGCAGMYKLKANASNACYSFTDVVPIEVSCGPKPKSIISHCQGTQSQCNLDQVRPSDSSYPSEYQGVTYYNYDTSGFQSFVLSGYESHDTYADENGNGRELIREWRFDEDQIGAYLNNYGDFQSELVVQSPGEYKVDYKVMASSCAESTSSVTFKAVCPLQCVASFDMTARTYTVGPSFTNPFTELFSTVTNETCTHLRDWKYQLSKPAYYAYEYYDSYFSLNPVTDDIASGFGLPISNISVNPQYAGTYGLTLITTDGCDEQNFTIPLEVSCEFPLSPLTISGETVLNSFVENATIPNLQLQANFAPTNPLSVSTLWIIRDGVSLDVYTILSVTPLDTQLPVGYYKIDVVVNDGCQFVNMSTTVNVTCSPPEVDSSLIVDMTGSMPNITVFPVDSQFDSLSRNWFVYSPSGNQVAYMFDGEGILLNDFTDGPGSYKVELELTNACQAKQVLTTSLQWNVPYVVELRTAFTGPITTVMSSVNSTFPQVTFDANSTNLIDFDFDQIVSNSFWYIVSAPEESVLLPKKTFAAEFSNYSYVVSEYADYTEFNSTTSIVMSYQSMEIQYYNYTMVQMSRLQSQCYSSDSSRSGMFRICFRPDVAGTYEIQLRATGSYGEIYELPAPITVEAVCSSELLISEFKNNRDKFSQSFVVGTDFKTHTRYTLDAADLFSDISNIQQFGWVFYSTNNAYDAVYNFTTDSYDYIFVKDRVSRRSYYDMRMANNQSNVVSVMLQSNDSNWLAEISASTGCQTLRFNASVEVGSVEANPSYSAIEATGGARFAGNQTADDGKQVMQLAYSPDKRSLLDIYVKVRGDSQIEVVDVSFERCNVPGKLSQFTTAGGLSAGAIAGIVIGAIVGTALISGAAFLVYSKMKGVDFTSSAGKAANAPAQTSQA